MKKSTKSDVELLDILNSCKMYSNQCKHNRQEDTYLFTLAEPQYMSFDYLNLNVKLLNWLFHLFLFRCQPVDVLHTYQLISWCYKILHWSLKFSICFYILEFTYCLVAYSLVLFNGFWCQPVDFVVIYFSCWLGVDLLTYQQFLSYYFFLLHNASIWFEKVQRRIIIKWNYF